MYSDRDVFDVKRRYERELFEKRGVRGVGIGYKMVGCSIGHYKITAGTFGCLAKRGYDTFILKS